jgi:ATP-dependent RNA helicase RhlB
LGNGEILISLILQKIRKRFRKAGNDTSPKTSQQEGKLLEKARTEKRVKEERKGTKAQHLAPSSQHRRGMRKQGSFKGKRPSSPGAKPLKLGIEVEKTDSWDISEFQVPLMEGKTRFHDLDLPVEIMHAIADLGFQYCTPIQTELLPKTLTGMDAAGRAQTGTGKTAVFLISILTHLGRNPASDKRPCGAPRALILAPTRELVLQIEKDAMALARYIPCKIISVFGGMDYEKQKRWLKKEVVDIVVATPGRLLDFKRKNDVRLDKVEILIIDEADRMLDMGFIPDMCQIIYSTPPKAKRQTMLFSATLTPEITRLASQWTRNPVMVEIEPEQVAVDTVDQLIYITTIREKFALLYNIITRQNLERIIVFTNRRDETRKLADRLRMYGIRCAQLSGDVIQRKRIKTLEDFRLGRIRVLVATDVAGRGLHVESISHVINYNLPWNPEDYIHRIGRTGRAGASGTSISFASEDDSFQIPAIEEFMGRRLICQHPEDDWLTIPPPPKSAPSRPRLRRTSSPGFRRGGMKRRRS